MKAFSAAVVIFLLATLSGPASPGIRAQAAPPAPGLARNVLVVYNKMYRESRDVADYYMAARHIPAGNKCAIDVPDPNNYIPGGMAGYRNDVQKPIQKCLNAAGKENILYIVFSYMTPFKMWDPAAFKESIRSVDSLVADIWGTSDAHIVNQYYRPDQSAAAGYFEFQSLLDFRKANPASVIYSVWRLDAVNPAVAKGLVDKATAATRVAPSGRGCFDRRGSGPPGPDSGTQAGEWDIQRSAELVTAAGFSTTLDTTDAEFGTEPAPLRCENALFYGGWYSYGHYNDAFSWAEGAMGWHLDSLSFENPRDVKTWSPGAVAHGITTTTGVVGEPYLEYIPHLDSFFKAVLEGANVGDAMLRATPSLKWMNVNIGDPLYAPFASAPRVLTK